MVLYVPEPVDLPGHQTDVSTFIPDGKHGRAKLGGLVAIIEQARDVEVTYRWTYTQQALRLASPDEILPDVTLTDEEMIKYLRETPKLNFKDPRFQQFMETKGLFRRSGEDDPSVAYRALEYISKNIVYDATPNGRYDYVVIIIN